MKTIKYRKKPIVIRAVEVRHGVLRSIAEWCSGAVQFNHDGNADGIKIPTLEGDHKAGIGDFIIKGVKGEFYPCKPDIFKKTYDKV